MIDEAVTVEQFCRRYVEPMGEESDHVHIVALTDALQARGLRSLATKDVLGPARAFSTFAETALACFFGHQPAETESLCHDHVSLMGPNNAGQVAGVRETRQPG